MAEKKSPKPKAGKRANGKPEPAALKTRSKAVAPKPKPKAASTKNSREAKTTPGDVKAARKRVTPEPPPLPAPPAIAARRRGLPKPRVAEATASAVPSPEAQTERVARRPIRRRVRPAIAPPVLDSGNGAAAADLTEEERIESSKYDVRERPRRVFEEERFLFPETYEADRVRLLVKDPEWLFAHWDVSPGSLQRLRDDVGERAMALSRLTLKVEDPADAALSVVLLPEGARSWYVRTHVAHRAYRAQLGLTMPSGEFRALATSNIVVAPRSGPSQERARRRVAFSRARAAQAAEELQADGGAPAQQAPSAGAAAGSVAAVDYIDAAEEGSRPEPRPREQGGASDELGPGGASDTFRR